MRLKLSQDCHNLKLYCLRCRSEALKAQIIIFENHKNEIGIYFNVDTFILQRLFKGRFYFFHSMNFFKVVQACLDDLSSSSADEGVLFASFAHFQIGTRHKIAVIPINSK